MLEGLAWYAVGPAVPSSSSAIAPAWSWFSTNMAVSFISQQERGRKWQYLSQVDTKPISRESYLKYQAELRPLVSQEFFEPSY
jgi:hypothetical protein